MIYDEQVKRIELALGRQLTDKEHKLLITKLEIDDIIINIRKD